MRIHIEGKHTKLAPHLVGQIAEQLDGLNTPDEDILEAQVTLFRHKRCEAARVQLMLAGNSLQVTQRGSTPDAAVNAAMRGVQEALQDIRAARRRPQALDVWHTRCKTGFAPSLPHVAGEGQPLPVDRL
jgi:ribosome-associated translation inhibitor RaiA